MSGAPHPELERLRSEFPILQSRTYLNSCSLGALSRRSMGYLGEFQGLWNTLGASAWYELWWARLAELRGRVAQLLNAGDDEIALSPSVSTALTSIASAVDHSRRLRVVVAELDFPTLLYQWLARPGVEVVRVPSDDGIGIRPERWAEYVDERTALVATSHVFFSTGHVQRLEPIAEAARRAGALFLVDGYQGAGQLEVDPRAAGADVYVTGPLKWLLGGPGLAYLWVRRERIRELNPTAVSWFGAEDQFAFDADRWRPRADASRFAMGTPAVPTAYTALGGMELVLEAGMPRIAARVRALADDLVGRLENEGFRLRLPEPGARSAIVMLHDPRAAETVAQLAQRGIIVDHRGSFVRLSPHFYNTVEENERVVEALRVLRG